jgi:transitional endoplasmic reticulum ATPase
MIILSIILTVVIGLIFKLTPDHTIELFFWVLIGFGLLNISNYFTERKNKQSANAQATPSGVSPKVADIDIDVVTPHYTFADVDGMVEIKEKLLKAGRDIVNSKSKRNGILLHGDPGNGKTMIAEALAGELELKFMSVDFGKIASMWVNATTTKILKVFDKAEKCAPCVLFMDELDSILIDRNKTTSSDSEASKTMTAVLTRLVDIRGKGVVLIGATNLIDKLDQASIREGRFDYKIEVTAPDYVARIGILTRGINAMLPAPQVEEDLSFGWLMKQMFGGAKKHEPENETLPVDWDAVQSIAKRWEGYPVSRLIAVLEVIKERVEDNKINRIDYEQLTSALKSIQSGKGDQIPEDTPTLDGLTLSPEMTNTLKSIAMRMQNVDMIENIGGSVPKGMIFYGVTGAGKSLAARSLAKTTGWSFIKTTGKEIAKNSDALDSMVKKAMNIRPCIIFIDEADDILADRDSSFMPSTDTNDLLAVMDGSGRRLHDVVFIAATNHIEKIDSAALRAGRFTEKIEFKLPENSELLAMVEKWIASTKAPLEPEFNAKNIVGHLNGQSYANVEGILQQAVNNAVNRIIKNKNEKVRISDLNDAIRTIGI